MNGPNLPTTTFSGTAGPSAPAGELMVNHRTRVAVVKRTRMRARLVAAIMELWPQMQAGAGVVIDDVVKTAAVSRGSFYKHFTSLEEALDAIGRDLADEMTIGLMPVYDVLSDPSHRLAAGFQLFQWRAAFDPVWAHFVSRTDHLFRDPELLANLMVDLENGRNAGLCTFESVEIAGHFVIGATLGGIARVTGSKIGSNQISSLTRMVLLGLGMEPDRAGEAIALTNAHVLERAPGRLPWWHVDSHLWVGEPSTRS